MVGPYVFTILCQRLERKRCVSKTHFAVKHFGAIECLNASKPAPQRTPTTMCSFASAHRTHRAVFGLHSCNQDWLFRSSAPSNDRVRTKKAPVADRRFSLLMLCWCLRSCGDARRQKRQCLRSAKVHRLAVARQVYQQQNRSPAAKPARCRCRQCRNMAGRSSHSP